MRNSEISFWYHYCLNHRKNSMDRQYLNILRFVFAISDVILISTCLLVSCSFFSKYFTSIDSPGFTEVFACTLIWLLSTRLFSLYNQHTIIKRKCVYRATWRSIIVFILFFQLYLLLFSAQTYSITLLAIFYALIVVSFVLSRLTYRTFEGMLIEKFDKKRSISVLAIASVGGHWVQLLRLMPLFKANDVTFISTKGSQENTVDGYKYYSVPDANRNNKFDLIKCCFSIAQVIFRLRPEIIITTGAAPGLFGIFIGRMLGIKTVWIDSMANVERLSLSGHIALKVADRVYTQWEHLSTPKIVFAGSILE